MRNYFIKKIFFFIALLFFSFSLSLFAQNNNTTLKEISGTITHLNAPLANVNILIKGTSKGTKTDTHGNYVINAKVGDIINYSHVGFNTISIIVEDATSVINIKMTEKVNKLNETIVTAKKKRYTPTETEKNRDKPFKTAIGMVNPNSFTGKVAYFDNKDNLGRFSNFTEAWDNMYVNTGRVLPCMWDVDGIVYRNEPFINLHRIVDIHVVKNGLKWGSRCGVIIVRTLDSPHRIAKRKEAKAEKHRNKNYYNDDAIANANETTFSSSNLTKSVSGKVTHLFAPVPNVNIIIKGTSKGTKTNNNGEYSLQANIGDILEYSHLNYTTVAILVEDVTSTLNIELQEKDNKLNEVVVKTRIDQKALEFEKKMNVELKTSFGTFNPLKSGHSIKYVSGKELNKGAPNIVYALNGKVAGLKRIGKNLYFRGEGIKEAIYIVDGLETKTRFVSDLSINNIEDIYTIPYKNLIIIRTINSIDIQTEKREAKEKQYQNQNYYNADAITTSDDVTFSSSNIKTSQPKFIISKNIRGKVSYLDAPMPLVNIKIVGKNTGVKTDPKGTYNIKANVGDIIQYSHLGFARVSIIVEDITEVLDIEMVLKENELSVVTVTTDGKLGKTLEQAKKREQTFNTSRGNIDPKRTGFALSYFDGADVSAMYSSLGEALDGKMPGVKYDHIAEKLIVKPRSSINTPTYAIWDVDGVIYEDEPPMDLNNIEDVRILKTLAGTNRYGSAGAGGVVLVQTINGDFNPIEAMRKKIADQYTNKDFYANDASQISLESLNSNTYADALEKFPSKQKAYIYYDEKLKNQLPSYVDHLAIAQKFVSHFNDLTLSTQIFKEQIEQNNKNPEVLKAIAFHLQTIGRTREAIDAYEHTFKLRPQYAQSYRDLANAYMENNQFKKSWRLYLSFLMQGKDVNSEGIGEIIYNEMEWLYFSRRNQSDIKEKFVPKSENLFDFRNDVRIIVEWNSSEAEFDLEFVNPELRSYVFDHSLAGNQALITDEKQKGYSSKEFFIDDIGIGEWLINITYKGNKKPEPTYFKVTKYYNWGKASQTQEIAVYKFQNEREKIQLMQLNKELLVAAN